MTTHSELFARALRYHQSGNRQQAHELYTQVLAVDPTHAEAWHFLGVLAHQSGRHDSAIEFMNKAIALNGANAACHANLGTVYQAGRQLSKAAACFREALRLKPDLAEAHNNLANALKEQGQHEEAAQHYRQAMHLKPDYAEAHNGLGTVLKEQQQLVEAAACYRQALRCKPDYATAHTNLGAVLMEQGKPEEALACHQQALRLQPSLAEAHYNLGNTLLVQGRPMEAAASYQEALRLRPDFAEAYSDLGSALKAQGKLPEALASYQKALQIRPTFVEAHCNVANAQLDQGKIDEAKAYYQSALRIKPIFTLAHTNLLFCLNHDPKTDVEALFAEHRRWGSLHGRVSSPPPPHTNDPNPERRLRVGYVSPDFRKHPVARFFEPILANHDRAQVEAYCYAELRTADEVTARLQASAHGWRSTIGLSDLQVADLIRGDHIDILVDLAGHTASNRLKVFAHKPAPVQVTYLGYPNTSGLTSIDYRVTDAVLDPPGAPWAAPGHYTEELVRLPGGFFCFAPPTDAPEVTLLPALRAAGTGSFTFGSTHRLEKLNSDVIDLWCRVLQAIPSARLLIFWSSLTDLTVASLRNQFAERGIHGERLELRHQSPHSGYLGVYGDIDVVLDVFPWTGHATTCESLWMGVPLITLAGMRPACRLTASVLTCLGLTEFIADTPERYVALAARVASDREWLAGLRGSLRERMRTQLCDGRRFTRGLEETYRTMWRTWCSRPRTDAKVAIPPGEYAPRPASCGHGEAESATPAELFTRASQHHQAGQLQEADELCRQAVHADPDHADAWHLLGLLAYQRGQYPPAIEALQKAVAREPANAVFQCNLAEIYRSAGKAAEAEASARRALQLHPGLAEAYNNLALALAEQDRLGEAVTGFQQALQCKPDDAEVLNNLGNVLQRQGTPQTIQEAATRYEQALRLQPRFALAHNNLGNVRREQGRLDVAEACYREALRWQPDLAGAHNNLGAVLQELGRTSEAEACFREALRRQPDFAAAHANLGNALRDLGKLDEALACYREALRWQPDSAQAHYNMGNALLERDERDEALASYRQALRLQPDFAEAHSNLGNALMAQGKLEEAVTSFRQALRLKPELADAHNNLGVALMQQGNLEEAAASHRQALQLRPDFADAHNALGNVLRNQGKVDEAVACYQEALRHQPANVEARYSLGSSLLNRRQFDEAAAFYQDLLRREPDCVLAHNNLGVAFMELGKLIEAAACFRDALRLDPNHALAHNNLGIVLMEQGQRDEALAHYEQAVRINPEYAEAHSNLGNNLKAQGKLAEAVVSNQQALRLKPHFAEAHNNMGVALLEQGKLAEAEACYREALRLKPQYASAHSNLLFCLNYNAKADPGMIFAEHRRWGELHGKPARSIPPHVNDPTPGRRLRIGYVSPDFRNHAVAKFFEPILANHDPECVEAVCYAEVLAPDAMTAHLRALAHDWRSTVSLSDLQMADMVREDRIDILVDLAGHTAHQRLGAFAYRPAPVQITYLGYPNTTGLTSIDYRLTDAVLDPLPAPPCQEGEEPREEGVRYTEELVRLPQGVCCFAPPRQAPVVTPLPALMTGHITFGSLHNLAKLNAEVIDLWCQVLRAVPSARLLLFRNTLTGETREFVRRQFTDRGLAVERLDLRHQSARGADHLAAYADIDLSLDVFPWTGHVISCEALWMGVPVLTLQGTRPATRLTASVLTHLGLPELIAKTPEQYVALAVTLAGDLDRLAQLRFGLRERMRTRLCDGSGFTRGLEQVYRALWRRWCARSASSPGQRVDPLALQGMGS